jgi:hypothetical protein
MKSFQRRNISLINIGLLYFLFLFFVCDLTRTFNIVVVLAEFLLINKIKFKESKKKPNLYQVLHKKKINKFLNKEKFKIFYKSSLYTI